MARVRQGRVTIEGVELIGVNLTVKDLRIPPFRAGTAPALRGSLKLSVRQVIVGKLKLRGLSLSADLAETEIRVRKLTLGLPGGQVVLAGTVGLGGGKRGPGPFALSGRLKLPSRPGAASKVSGAVRLEGPTLSRLELSGKLSGASAFPGRGGTAAAPPIKLLLAVGDRKVRGTLRSWRAR